MRSHLLLLPLVALLLPACAAPHAATVPLRNDLGTFHRPVTTTSPQAQHYVDQGFVLTFAFDHAEAIRSFERAAELDPTCAMAHYGVALACGPHINNPLMDEAATAKAVASSQRATALREQVTSSERALIDAVALRYVLPLPEDRSPLDRDYAEAMRDVWRSHPLDADVGALFAEALMNLRPWDLWTADGSPRPETPEIVETLERVLDLRPDHPLANHLYIHAIEASPHPELALASADRLRNLVPGAAHLVHMPSHIDIRLGHYDNAVVANQRAIESDRRFPARAEPIGLYAMYRAHNYHFLVYAAMFDGRSGLAMDAARGLLATMPLATVRQMPDMLDAFVPTPLHVMVRFGQWDQILSQPPPPADLPVTIAFWHYARALAYSSLGRVSEATVERGVFERAAAAVPESAFIGNNPARTVFDVGRAMVAGELEYRRGNHDTGFAHLREAVRIDDSLRYDEPWGWMQPARHALGALLLEQGRVGQAESTYREDLAIHPGNGWALHGLAECRRRQGDEVGAEEVAEALAIAWERADVAPPGSCYCRTGAATAGAPGSR